MEIKTKNYWVHFTKYFGLITFLNLVIYWIGKEINQNTKEMLFLNILFLSKTFIISVFMIYFYFGKKSLTFIEKVIPILIILLLDVIISFLINYFNFFDRIINSEDIRNGIERSSEISFICFALLSIIIVFVNSKKIQ